MLVQGRNQAVQHLHDQALLKHLAWQDSDLPVLQEIAYSAILQADTPHLHQTHVLVEV